MNFGRQFLRRANAISKGDFFNKNGGYIRRWPQNPKIAVHGPPGIFVEEIAMR